MVWRLRDAEMVERHLVERILRDLDGQQIVGRRLAPVIDIEKADGFLKLVLALRDGKPFIPKGVHRFRTFEESNQWSLDMISRKPNPGPRK